VRSRMRRSGTSSGSRGSRAQGITDGEFRRTYFHIDFLEQLEGVETRGDSATSTARAAR
jgi:methionine synthase II (cobalamin-independent)